jgi:hypothetical protein
MIDFDDVGRAFYQQKVLEYQEPKLVNSLLSSESFF